ncbi:hypothetical protein ACJA23_03495 [Mycoplasma corogypsi]|uniref:hypothetical protein n=1 Tax=Mycoplasma corogypsi TaxID=2106 RepID=UPI0038735C70
MVINKEKTKTKHSKLAKLHISSWVIYLILSIIFTITIIMMWYKVSEMVSLFATTIPYKHELGRITEERFNELLITQQVKGDDLQRTINIVVAFSLSVIITGIITIYLNPWLLKRAKSTIKNLNSLTETDLKRAKSILIREQLILFVPFLIVLITFIACVAMLVYYNTDIRNFLYKWKWS